METTIQAALQHHQAGRLSEAEKIYRRILAENPNHPDALHLLGVIAFNTGHKETASDLIGRAIQLSPNSAEFHSNFSAVLESLNQADAAIAAARRALALNPRSAGTWYNFGNALRSQQDMNGALAAYRRSLEISPNQPEVRGNLGVTLKAMGRLKEAIAEFSAIVAAFPHLPQAQSNLGDALRDDGQVERSIAVLQQAIAIDPNYALAHNNLGTSLQKAGRSEEAVAYFRRAAELQPDLPEAHNNLANTYHRAGDLDKAIAEFAITVKLRPTFAEAWSNLGNTLKEKGRIEQSIAACRQAIAIKPNYSDAYYNLGNALKENNQQDEAIEAYDRAIQIDPANLLPSNNKGSVLKEQGRQQEAIACYEQFLSFQPDNPGVRSNRIYVQQFIPGVDPAELFEVHRQWDKLHGEPLKAFIKPHENNRSPDRRLRVGYVSPDFRLHSVSFFLLPLLEAHDKTKVHVTCYYSQSQEDDVTVRLRAAADQWRDISALSGEKAADLIRNDQIDILVDLAGHTAHNSLPVFARKPAPVQVTYLGYPGTTGMETMDWRLVDQNTDPPDAEKFHTEKLFRLSRTSWCFAPLSGAPSIEQPDRTNVVFGSFNDLAKITLPLLALWSRLLQQIPESRLFLKNRASGSPLVRRRLQDQLRDLGIASERLEFAAPCVGSEEHLRCYNRLDIALDTFPYNGTTTTCEALWMGVPVVTLAGHSHVGRVGVSLITSLGLTDLIAADENQYIRIAAELANNASYRKELRATLRQRMQKSPLMDAPDLARQIEAAYRQMWHQWLETR